MSPVCTCRLRPSGRKGGCAAHRPLIFAGLPIAPLPPFGLRCVWLAPEEDGQWTPEEEGAGLAGETCKKIMDKRDIEALRGTVFCGALLERDGWRIDLKQSTRRAVKYRRADEEIVIVIHNGKGWFDPLSDAKGDVFKLAEHLGAAGFVAALDRVAETVGFVTTAPIWERPARAGLMAPIATRWGARNIPRPGSPTWRYLAVERRLPDSVIRAAIEQDLLREGPYGSMWAAHTDAAGQVNGWEERGPDWRGFATDGAKTLFCFGAAGSARICVTEAAIDAMSLATLEGPRSDTLYLSTGGGWSPSTDAAIGSLVRRPDCVLVGATDADRQGDAYAERLRVLADEAGCHFSRLKPDGEDWNDQLRRQAAGNEIEGGK